MSTIPTTLPTGETVPPGVILLEVLREGFFPGAPHLVPDPQLAAQIFLLTAQQLQAAAQNPAVLSPALLPLFLRVLRQTAKIYFAGQSSAGLQSSQGQAVTVEAAFAAGVFTLSAGTAPDARAQAAAAQLVILFTAVPVGGLNSAAAWIRAHATQS